MNVFRNKYLLSKLSTSSNSFYSILLKTKFRRLTQPGLTRYNYEEYDQESGSMDFSRLSHKSNAEELISAVPTIEVDDHVAICLGVNNYGWGHPTEYITLNTRDPTTPAVCKYCGLSYVKKQGH